MSYYGLGYVENIEDIHYKIKEEQGSAEIVENLRVMHCA
jgi:hypothetical protein